MDTRLHQLQRNTVHRFWYGKEAGNAVRNPKNIQNDIPIIGTYNVNREGSGDMYYKGGNMLHNNIQVINDDEKFRQILRGLNKTFTTKPLPLKEVEDYISKAKSKIDFSKVFDQYLRTTQIPVPGIQGGRKTNSYRYTNCVKGFGMPLKVKFKTEQWIGRRKTGRHWTCLYPEGDNNFTVDQIFTSLQKTE